MRPAIGPGKSAGGVVFAGSGGSVWALNASTVAILNGGAFLHTGGSMRMPVTIDGDWVFVIDNNGNLYGLTTDPRFPTVQAKRRTPTGRQLMPTWVEKRRDSDDLRAAARAMARATSAKTASCELAEGSRRCLCWVLHQRAS